MNLLIGSSVAERCPFYSIKTPTSPVFWAVVGRVDTAAAQSLPIVVVSVNATYPQTTLALQNSDFFALDPQNPAVYRGSIAVGPLYPGQYRNTAFGKENQTRDSVWAEFVGLRARYQPAYGFLVRPGIVESVAPRIAGVGSLTEGEVNAWEAVLDGHPDTYTYDWYLDGAPLDKHDYSLVTRLPLGQHILHVKVTRVDDTIENLYHSVSVTSCGQAVCADH